MKWDKMDFLNRKCQEEEKETILSLSHVRVGKNKFIKILAPMEVMVRFYKVDEEIWLHVKTDFTYQVKCDRCLENYEVSSPLEAEAKVVDLKQASDDEDALYAYYDGETLDLSQVLGQAILLKFPMKNLCSPTCKGLCPSCGTNLNKGNCDCKKEQEIDIRLLELTKFSKQ